MCVLLVRHLYCILIGRQQRLVLLPMQACLYMWHSQTVNCDMYSQTLLVTYCFPLVCAFYETEEACHLPAVHLLLLLFYSIRPSHCVYLFTTVLIVIMTFPDELNPFISALLYYPRFEHYYYHCCELCVLSSFVQLLKQELVDYRITCAFPIYYYYSLLWLCACVLLGIYYRTLMVFIQTVVHGKMGRKEGRTGEWAGVPCRSLTWQPFQPETAS